MKEKYFEGCQRHVTIFIMEQISAITYCKCEPDGTVHFLNHDDFHLIGKLRADGFKWFELALRESETVLLSTMKSSLTLLKTNERKAMIPPTKSVTSVNQLRNNRGTDPVNQTTVQPSFTAEVTKNSYLSHTI
jgi:hypothetical protein